MMCRSAPAETNPFRDASEEAGVKDRRREDKQSDEGEKRREDKPQDANTPVSNGIQGSGGAFTFNDKLLAPTSAAGPQMPPAGKCLSLPNASAGEPRPNPEPLGINLADKMRVAIMFLHARALLLGDNCPSLTTVLASGSSAPLTSEFNA